MVYNVIITVMLVVSFFLCLASYTMGFKQAKTIYKDNLTPKAINPLKTAFNVSKAYVTERADKKEAEKQKEELTDIMSYSKESALEHMKKEVR